MFTLEGPHIVMSRTDAQNGLDFHFNLKNKTVAYLRYSNPGATLLKRAPKPLRHEELAQLTRK
jgi:hypothetical protein